MQEVADRELLRQYVERNSDEAFASVVARHIHMVYSVALRKTGNPHAAEEITQAVFITLARKAGRLREKTILSGWLHQTARLTAAGFLRTEFRRARREHEASMQSNPNEGESDPWPQIAPLLDDAMGRLGEKERNAIALRFFEGKSFREIGAVFGASENAAKKRVGAGLERLRRHFLQRGVTLTTAALAGVISANSVQAAPPALAKAAIAAGLAQGAAAGASTLTLIKGAVKLMAWTKLKLGVGALVVAGVTTALVTQQRARTRRAGENEDLRGQIAQLESDNAALSRRAAAVTPASRVEAAAAPAEPPPPVSPLTNLYARLLKDGKETRLTAGQVQHYLEANGRDAGSLLASFRATGDAALLQEALRKFPGDPRVDFAAAVSKDLPPEERRQALDAFEKSAPDNALANCLSALDYFNTGNSDQAVRELIAASGKQQFQDYSKDFVQNAEETYLAAGYPAAEAKTLSTTGLVLPQLADLKQLGLDMVSLAASYRQAGDEPSAQATLQIAANLGQGYRNASGEQLVSQIVGMGVETMALEAMSPGSPYGSAGQTVQDRLDQLARERAAQVELTQQIGPIMETMPDQDWISFNDRLMNFGEEPAMQWLANKYGTK